MAEGMATEGLTLAWPWMLILLPLPWLARRWLSAAPQAGFQAFGQFAADNQAPVLGGLEEAPRLDIGGIEPQGDFCRRVNAEQNGAAVVALTHDHARIRVIGCSAESVDVDV